MSQRYRRIDPMHFLLGSLFSNHVWTIGVSTLHIQHTKKIMYGTGQFMVKEINDDGLHHQPSKPRPTRKKHDFFDGGGNSDTTLSYNARMRIRLYDDTRPWALRGEESYQHCTVRLHFQLRHEHHITVLLSQATSSLGS
jgi:hypothetical protein